MKRRGFLFGLLGATPAVALAAHAQAGARTLRYTLHCSECDKDYPDEIQLDRLIAKGTPQCPQCLMVLPMPDDLSKRIFAAQGRGKYGKPL